MAEKKEQITMRQVARAIGADFHGNANERVTDITHDSRKAKKGAVFVAIPGKLVDGYAFVAEAMQRGALGVISELPKPDSFKGVWLEVPDALRAQAKAAAVIFEYPSQEIDLVGVTGTNGKTTTAYIMNAIAETYGVKAAMLTTVLYKIDHRTQPAERTTPESSDTMRFLRNAVNDGCDFAVMEVSSQAIDLHRADTLKFDVAIFTNLTRDHLDYHQSMEEYFDAKKKLFDGRLGSVPVTSVINSDDAWGQKLLAELKSRHQNVVSYGIHTPAEYQAHSIVINALHGTSFTLVCADGTYTVQSPLIGQPHVYNLLSAIAAARQLNYPMPVILEAIKTCVGAPGRFELVPHEGDFSIIVDYAHTDDALLNILKTARSLTKGKIITVFGCGGDRDPSKRQPMGKIAGTYSSSVFVTSDNPRTEDPDKILKEIAEGLNQTTCPYHIIPDRKEAIFSAVAEAESGDMVIIAGKGHEKHQIIGTEKFEFNDIETARAAAREKLTQSEIT